jgi:hypothetical protein
MYGSPLASGYGPSAFRDFFSISNIPQNVADYAGRILIGERPALAIATVACVALVAVRRQRAAVPPATTAVMLAAFFAAIVVLCYLPYGVFPDWWYLRFLLPAFPALFALIGIAADLALARVTLPARGILLLVALTTACSFNIVEARRQQAFILRTGEARYDLAGRYLESTLPRNAVIVTSQESASAHVYTHLPIVRWDLLPIDLDAAVAQLTALGRRPLLLIEDWERRDLVARFPASALARLDWTPMADFGDPVRVGLFDPFQRGQTMHTDRVH